ncbi:hypothetical protein [Paractinoplanes brasiliensis]|uniref:Uncharacterized protein n=1 Tax=Paractinoplanes brasiliensis TaxID=52695 RepID=A0A4R6JW49_9ACTN|nr:hypothetical protein [Actinoplanes brasiliensis]MDY7089057.1 hypothetical protein [Actinomycetota bacterium]TDO40899.1 hypothetical protein C8E87_4619 [Actinoplanes brasiliensis]GID25967.1 hypothetical protein Abr02nite_09500 [Actinoplanes brasiliensis]
MDYQVSVTCEQLAELFMRVKGLADAHHGHPTGDHLKAIASEIYELVPSEWWASQPEPIDNRIRG